MELTVKIGYEQILNLVKQLPAGKIVQLKSALNDKFIEKKAQEEISDFQSFLLSGPVMTEEEYENFADSRKQWNQWRQK